MEPFSWCPSLGLEMVGVELPGRLLLVGAELEVLGGQFEAQRVGSQRVGHVLVAFSTMLHQEGTPVGLRGADQLQTLQEKRQIHQLVDAVGEGRLTCTVVKASLCDYNMFSTYSDVIMMFTGE